VIGDRPVCRKTVVTKEIYLALNLTCMIAYGPVYYCTIILIPLP